MDLYGLRGEQFVLSVKKKKQKNSTLYSLSDEKHNYNLQLLNYNCV